MRVYIRHPSDISIRLQVVPTNTLNTEQLSNFSQTGLCCSNSTALEKETIVDICIPDISPPFETRACVVWCHKTDDGYKIGLNLLNTEESYRLRMVEQICYIERYKISAARNGRLLSSDEAAQEWIHRYSERFPSWPSSA
ncbi:MAG: PilZ domain-containing protein [Gammaproteobacteria bacterium]